MIIILFAIRDHNLLDSSGVDVAAAVQMFKFCFDSSRILMSAIATLFAVLSFRAMIVMRNS